MTKKALWILFIVLAVSIGLYPSIYFFMDRQFGLLNTKPGELLENIAWNIAFYTHIISGGIALLSGWSQFSTRLRNKNMALHRQLGKVYVIAVLISAPTGFYIACFATGGLIPSLGFISLASVWFYTTLNAWLLIRKKKIDPHKKMMTYSYAACFAAVTLRIWLPLLIMLFQDFTFAYSIVAWLCWIPNLIVAYLITEKRSASSR